MWKIKKELRKKTFESFFTVENSVYHHHSRNTIYMCYILLLYTLWHSSRIHQSLWPTRPPPLAYPYSLLLFIVNGKKLQNKTEYKTTRTYGYRLPPSLILSLSFSVSLFLFPVSFSSQTISCLCWYFSTPRPDQTLLSRHSEVHFIALSSQRIFFFFSFCCIICFFLLFLPNSPESDL